MNVLKYLLFSLEGLVQVPSPPYCWKTESLWFSVSYFLLDFTVLERSDHALYFLGLLRRQ